jgi:hypothetical protein
MRIQYVSKYIALSQEGLVSKMACPTDQGLLYPNLDLDDNIYLYCVTCDYSKTLGLELYDKIVKQVESKI